MPRENMCKCVQQSNLKDITQCYSSFIEALSEIETGNWVVLQKCDDCGQLWRVDAWDKLQTLYALKISSPNFWEAINMEPLIKEKMIANHGGLSTGVCVQSGCAVNQLKGKAFCVNHLFENGHRA